MLFRLKVALGRIVEETSEREHSDLMIISSGEISGLCNLFRFEDISMTEDFIIDC